MLPLRSKVAFVILMGIHLSVIVACNDDDLKNATAISAKKVTLTKDRSYGVEVIYSDSGIVKGKGFVPILDKVTPSMGAAYSEMPKGVKIEFYDEFLKKTGTITSEYAIFKETERITVFRKNVVVVTESMTFTTEELIWDENRKLYTSPYGTVKGKDGSIVTGTKFSAPQDFSTYHIMHATAEGDVKADLKP